jgi:hypothetical protein
MTNQEPKEPKEPKKNLIVGTANSVSNTAMLILSAFQSPFTINTVVPPNAPQNDPAARTGGPGFNLALIAIIGITVLCGIAFVVMAGIYPDHPNTTQDDVLHTMTHVFWAGIGCLIGLITGKAT